MTPHCVKDGDISQGHQLILSVVRNFVSTLKDGLNCHEVCAAVVEVFPNGLTHYKGKFNHADHSWLVFKRDPETIIDPYPWACASGPILLTLKGYCNPWRRLYVGSPVIGAMNHGSRNQPESKE